MPYNPRRSIFWDAATFVILGACCALVFVNSHDVYVTTLTGIIGFTLIACGLALAVSAAMDL